MPEQLPLAPSIPNYRVGTVLGGTQYLIDVRWNARDGAWYMDVLAEDETPIALGIKIVLGAFLGGHVTDPSFPDGLLLASDLTGRGMDAGFDDLGAGVVVNFWTRAELETIAGG